MQSELGYIAQGSHILELNDGAATLKGRFNSGLEGASAIEIIWWFNWEVTRQTGAL